MSPGPLPPIYVNTPVGILYDLSIPPEIRDTWGQLYGMAWDSEDKELPETPALKITDIERMTGKKRSTLYGHLAYLRDRGKLRFAAAGEGTLRVSFPGFPLSKSKMLDEHIYIPPQLINLEEDISISEIQNFGQSRRKPSGSRKTADERSKSPAILCAKGITSRYPPKELYDDIIKVLGESPDGALAVACRKEWLRRGYNPNSWNWLLDWYPAGGPPSRNGNGAATARDAPIPEENPEELERRRAKFLALKKAAAST